MKKLTIVLLLVLLLPIQVRERATAAGTGHVNRSATVEPAHLQALSDFIKVIHAHGESPDDQGVLIETLDGGQALASHNTDVPFNPASVMKLATSLVALEKFGPDYRYQTSILADGAINSASHTLEGDLVIDGGADPMFSAYDAQQVAESLSRMGILRVSGALRITGSFYYFAMGYHSNLSPETSASKLRTAIERGRIRITGGTVFGKRSGNLLLTHYSDPLVSILLFQNAHSSNAVAEVVGVSVGGPRAIQDCLVKQFGLSDDEIFVGRASGLEFNRLTPRIALKVLRTLIAVLADHFLKPEDVLAVAGVDSGTMQRRLASQDIRCAVVAKTGTLVSIDNGVSTLVGIAYTRAHGSVLFAVFNSGGGVRAYRRLQDQFIEQMIAEVGGAAPATRSVDALADVPRQSIIQVF